MLGACACHDKRVRNTSRQTRNAKRERSLFVSRRYVNFSPNYGVSKTCVKMKRLRSGAVSRSADHDARAAFNIKAGGEGTALPRPSRGGCSLARGRACASCSAAAPSERDRARYDRRYLRTGRSLPNGSDVVRKFRALRWWF